jgi:formylglycine-generating enzyme required for sulfatase activity/ribosomal protein L40E
MKLYHHQQEIDQTMLLEWEIDLEGCPNLECQHVNPAGAEKCQKCGVSLNMECPNCYNEIPVVSSYCRICSKQNLENWNLFCRFVTTIKLTLQRGLYNKAATMLSEISKEFHHHPEFLALEAEIKKGCNQELIEHVEEMKKDITQQTDSLRQKWIGKVREILSESHPDFVLASRAFDSIPTFLHNPVTQLLQEEISQRREEVVELGRKRKRALLLQKVDILKEQGDYEGALSELSKFTGPLEDSRADAKRQEIQEIITQQQKLKSLQEGPAWAHPGELQKQVALTAQLPVAHTFELSPGVSLCFILIPPGSFKMGCDDSYENERPRHNVVISNPFYMAITPVTQEQWEATGMPNRSHFRGKKLPVENVSWEDCCFFLMVLTKKFGEIFRLPTEAEWEYACRASSESLYFFGDSSALLEEYAWFNKNSNQQTHEVATKRPNAYGLYDMHGNVWEWCQDYFVADYYSKSSLKDPMGPSGQKHSVRTHRGGAWNNVPSDLRCSMRHGGNPTLKDYTTGLRPLWIPGKAARKKT